MLQRFSGPSHYKYVLLLLLLLSKTTLYKCATALSLMVKVEHHKLRPDKMKVSSLAYIFKEDIAFISTYTLRRNHLESILHL